MHTINWQADSRGTSTFVPTSDNPGLFLLSPEEPISYQQFNSSADLPVGEIPGSVQTSNFFALYVELSTDRGRRQIKATPTIETTPVVRFSYRYETGLGAGFRNGELQPFVVDVLAIATAAEPGVTIESVNSVFLRTRNDVVIELTDPSTSPSGSPEEMLSLIHI